MREYDTVQFTKMVRKIKLFSSMQMDLLEKILAWVSLYSFKKGENICRQGGTGDSYFVIYEGAVTVTVKKWFFLSRRLAVLGPGDCFGEMALLRQAPRNATVMCKEDTRVFMLLAEHFHDALAGNPDFAEEVRKLALERELEDKCGYETLQANDGARALELARACLKMGAFDYLAKPANLGALETMVRTCLAGAGR